MNADKKVNVTDVMCVANYIVGITPEVFIEEAADVNASGSINITDLIAIANIAVGNSSAPALNRRLLFNRGLPKNNIHIIDTIKSVNFIL